tara:strand:+ start:197 stop:346 length:150 start_codon:yes stop_codon:yes gene_type:complete
MVGQPPSETDSAQEETEAGPRWLWKIFDLVLGLDTLSSKARDYLGTGLE